MINTNQFSTTNTVYDKPNSTYFQDYVNFIKKSAGSTSEVPDQFIIPLNPPPVPLLKHDDQEADFSKCFEAATNYILYAATACKRLRVDDELSRRSKLRWYSVLSDLYDRYRDIVASIPALKGNKDVASAAEIAEAKKRDKKKRNALAKEVMAGRRINKLLGVLRGQWNVIDLHDCITRDFLINNSQDFFDALTTKIRWPSKYDTYDLPYKILDNSCSSYQFIYEKKNDGNEDYYEDSNENLYEDYHSKNNDEEEEDEEEEYESREELDYENYKNDDDDEYERRDQQRVKVLRVKYKHQKKQQEEREREEEKRKEGKEKGEREKREDGEREKKERKEEKEEETKEKEGGSDEKKKETKEKEGGSDEKKKETKEKEGGREREEEEKKETKEKGGGREEEE